MVMRMPSAAAKPCQGDSLEFYLIIVIMEYLVKITKKARILELKQRHLKITVLTSYTPYPSKKIRRICACTSQETKKIQSPIRHIQETSIRRIQYKVIKYSKDIERGPYSKKPPIRHIQLSRYAISTKFQIVLIENLKMDFQYA
ncbi:hypothetical protein Tco_1441088 [Tanacetum coccineum]